MKQDILHREDIVLLVNSFYEKVRENAILGPIFTEVAQIDWDKHLPKMYDFWSAILLNEKNYSGNPMQKHIALSNKTPLTYNEFNEWLQLFIKTVDSLFAGRTAELAKYRAESIANLMLDRINVNV